MRLLLRVDDFGLRPDKSTDTALELARAFHEALGGLPYLAGIIPGLIGPEGRAWIRSRPRGLRVALHGWKHRLSAGGVESEFHDLDLDGCRPLLRRGQRLIGPTEDFIPPWNAAPEYLQAACAAEGLRRIWGEPRDDADPPAPERTAHGWYIPAWRPLYGATLWHMGDGRPALVDCLEAAAGRVRRAVVTLHVTWEAVYSPSFWGVARLADRYGPDLVGPEEFLEDL